MPRRVPPPDPSSLSGPALMQRIADEVGVSSRTVYRVLNQRSGEVWASAVSRGERIRELAKAYGYRPNLAARTTRTGRFGAVSLVIGFSPTSSSFPLNFIKGAHDGLAQAGLNLMISRIHDKQLEDVDGLPAFMHSQMVDGLLIYYDTLLPAHAEQALAATGLPCLWINIKRTENCVYYDDIGAGRLATEKLLALGHRRIAFAGQCSGAHYSIADRYDGYCSAMQAAGCRPTVLGPEAALTPKATLAQKLAPLATEPDSEDRPSLMTAHLSTLDHWPTAVVTPSDADALAVYIAAQRLGRMVPADLSIITISQRHERGLGIAFSMAVCESYTLGIAAGQHLAGLIAEPGQSQAPFAVSYEFSPGVSHSSL